MFARELQANLAFLESFGLILRNLQIWSRSQPLISVIKLYYAPFPQSLQAVTAEMLYG